MRHIDAQMKNSLVGALLGAVVDIAAATQGVNTDFAREGAKLGSMVFSQDFEREADYVGLYILSLGGRPINEAANLWRLMGAANPGSIRFASSHPTTAERFVRLDNWRGEIDSKIAAGKPLQPDMKNGKTFLVDGPSARSVASAVRSAPGSSISSLTAGPKTSAKADALRESAPPSPPQQAAAKRDVAAASTPSKATVAPTREKRGSQATIGAPSSDSDRVAAIKKFKRGIRP